MTDVDDVIREHIDELCKKIWQFQNDAEQRLVCLCTAAAALLFNQCRNLERKSYEKYMNLVIQLLRGGAWFLWKEAHQRRRT